MKRESKKRADNKSSYARKGVSEIAREVGVSKSYACQVKKELERERYKDKGKIEAETFKLLKEGKRPEDLVIELQIPAEEAERIYKTYLKLSNLSLAETSKKIGVRSENEVRKLKEELLRIVCFIGDFGTVEELEAEVLTYASGVVDALRWILGEITTEEFLRDDDFLHIKELEKIIKKIEKRTGKKFKEYK